MNFQCQIEDLRLAVNHISLFSSSRSSIPALEGILLICKANRLQMKAYDLEIGIQKEIQISSKEDGEIVVSAQIFSEILKKMEDNFIEISTDEKNRITLKGEKTEFHLLGIQAEDFPELPNMNQTFSIQLPDKQLKKLIDQTLFAASGSTQMPVLNGALFEKKGDLLTVAAVDGYRVAIAMEKVEEGKDFRFIVPTKALQEISKIMEEQGENKTNIAVGDKHVSFEIGGYQVMSRLLEGEFIDYKKAVPSEIKTEILIDKQTLAQAIERVSIMINIKNKTAVKMDLEEGKITLHCETSMGDVKDEIDIDIKGEKLNIAYNNRYMIEALRHARSEKVKIRFNGPLAPIAIYPEEGEDFIYLVLPVRIKAVS